MGTPTCARALPRGTAFMKKKGNRNRAKIKLFFLMAIESRATYTRVCGQEGWRKISQEFPYAWPLQLRHEALKESLTARGRTSSCTNASSNACTNNKCKETCFFFCNKCKRAIASQAFALTCSSVNHRPFRPTPGARAQTAPKQARMSGEFSPSSLSLKHLSC